MAGNYSNKKVVLCMQQRLEILEDLKTQPISTIAAKYGVHPMTIRRIRKNATLISEFADKSKEQKKRRRLKKPMCEELDHRMLTWFTERRALKDILSDAILLEKAAEIKKNITSCSSARVSKGWLAKFKRRNNIRLVNGFRDKNNTDVNAARIFVKNFRKLIEEENINVENIYNMDESRLMWKALPTKVLAKFKEERIGGFKISSERITIALCANASGTNKIIPFLIYKYQNPRSLKDCQDILPVIFKSQANGCMDQSLFIDWFENHFKPNVRAFQLQKQICGKVILLLNNCEEDKVPIDIQEDDYVKIIHLPPHTDSLVQPMHQGIIQKTKRLFRHGMLQNFLRYDRGIKEFYKDYTIKDCIDILHKSWIQITSDNIKAAWNEVITLFTPNFEETEETDSLQHELQDMISTITGEKSTQEHVTEFLSACEEVERRHFIFIKEEKIDEEESEEKENNNDNKDEEDDEEEENIDDNKGEDNLEEQKELLVARGPNENTRYDSKYLFEDLMCYSAKAPQHIQLIVKSLKQYFLNEANE